MDTNELRKAAILAITAVVEQDLSDKLEDAAVEIDRLREEALHKHCICNSLFGYSKYCPIHGYIG